MEEKVRFYQSPYLLWFSLVIYPPIGIIILWTIGHFDIFIRLFISFVFGLIYLEFLGYYSSFIRALIYTLVFSYFIWRYYKLQEYKEKFLDQYEKAVNNYEVEKIIKQYLSKFESPTHCFKDIIDYELFLRNKYKVLYKNRLAHIEDLFINHVYHELKAVVQLEKTGIDSQEIINNERLIAYDKKNMDLSLVLSPKLKLTSDKLIHYFLWQLLKDHSIEYYGDHFYKTYQNEFKGVDINNLSEIVLRYVSNDALNTDENSQDLAMFTYFLMKSGTLGDERDFTICFKKISEEIKLQVTNRKFILFEKRLLNTSETLIKEVESINIINQMHSKDRFMILIQDLLKALDYQDIDKPINKYLDFIYLIHNEPYGINVVYQKKSNEHIKVNEIQNMKLGLTYNDIKRGIIISNGTFTSDAIKLAEANQIQLWDQNKLKEKISFVKQYFENSPRLKPVNEIKITDLTNIPFEQITITEIDKMSGFEFQYYVAEIFKRNGYKIIDVLKTHDSGVDVILEKNGIRFGIQTKRYSSEVNSNAIKEIIAGLPVFDLQVGFVVTNSTFTKEAYLLANVCQIILWDRDQLVKEINFIKTT